MFNPNNAVIDAFSDHTRAEFERSFPDAPTSYIRTLDLAIHTALETLLNCDCPYHDLVHTIMVTDVGRTMLQGRQLARGDITMHDWLQTIVSLLFHDVGYVRKLLRGDTDEAAVIDAAGNQVAPPSDATDAFMTPFHVDRGTLFVRERFANDAAIDTDMVAACIEMTRFPVPKDAHYQVTDTIPALVRAADLVGQMADPQYLQKLSRLHAEFVETGEAERMNFSNAAQLRSAFPEFFYNEVYPYVREGLNYLTRTQEGQAWTASLYHHLHVSHNNREADPAERVPELVVNNSASA